MRLAFPTRKRSFIFPCVLREVNGESEAKREARDSPTPCLPNPLDEAPMKKTIVFAAELIARMPFIPFSLKHFIAMQDPRFFHILPEGKEMIFDKYLGDVKVRINTVYPVERQMLTGTYDSMTSTVLGKFLDEGSVAMDIGANVGALTLLMAKICGSGRVIAVEPGPPTRSRLMKNLELNPKLRKSITVFPVGASDKPGKLFWSEDPRNRGNAGLLNGSGTEVDVVTLDDIVARARLTRLDFIKIDVEGMEYEVVKGGLASIQKYRPLVYYETLEPFRTFRKFDIYGEIFEAFHSMRYRHFYFKKNGNMIEIKNMGKLHSSNALAMPAEKAPAREWKSGAP